MKLIGKILLGLIALVLILAGTVLAVWMKPELVLTDSRVNSLFDQYAGSYFSKRPENLKLGFKAFGFTGKRVLIEASNFCLKEPDACFKTVQVGFAFRVLTLTKVKIEELGPIEILNDSFNYTVTHTPEVAPTPSSKTSSWRDHLEVPINLRVKDIQIEFPKVAVLNGKEIISGKLSIQGKETDQMNIDASATSNRKMEGSLGLHTSLVLNRQNPFDAKLHFKQGKGSIDGSLKGNVEWSKLQGKVEGELAVRKFIPWIGTLYVRNLKIDHEDKIRLSADLETRLEQELSFNRSKSVLPKVSLNTNFRGKVEAVAEKDIAHYKLQLGANERGLVLDARAAGTFPFPKGQEYKYGIENLFLSLNIPVFQNLVKSLRLTNYAVPAPFSILKGKVTLKVGQDNGELVNDTIPVSFITNLDSTEQTIKTQSKAEIVFAPKPKKLKISGESMIESIRITLPDLKVLEPTPLVKNDPRLVSATKEQKELKQKEIEESGVQTESPVDLAWKVKTAPSGIRIYHPILKPYAPIEANWEIGDQKNGSVELKPFEIEYLNRTAKVETLKFYQKPGDSKFRYDGRLVIVKTDYTVFVNIIQDGEKPKVVLTSDPPLEQGDIISVLLFNQTGSELDTDQTSSVASTQSAVTSRALGLFSILALSSTPVEAVNFNPATGIYSARVKLANGLTATVGTDWDKTQEVALRKRLGKNFVLSTILQSDPETNSETRKTLIEWFRRF